MKTLLTLLLTSPILCAEPLLSSWYTERSGAYARIYETDADQASQNAVTTWNRGAGVQDSPTYAGIHEISCTADWIYIRTTNLASYIMGPWYLNTARTNLFPNYPSNQAVIHRFPRTPDNPSTVFPKILTGGGAIGYMVNGVALFDSRDAFSYDSGTGTEIQGNGGDLAWNRDAYVNEGVTFDAGLAHQAGGGHHYHANAPALRHQLGDSVDHDPPTNTYTENFNGQHSPIIGWYNDGLPVYGPYGYSSPNDPNSGVRRMISGYQIRTDIAANGSLRNTWPAWATRLYTGAGRTFFNGPNVSTGFPLGRYLEDNDYKGDLGLVLGFHFDLNEHNARFCVTPEFPGGTWAYFTAIEADGTPAFPYNIGPAFLGNPTGDGANGIPDSSEAGSPVSILFEGGPEHPIGIRSASPNNPTPGEVTITWNAVQGGSYMITENDDLEGDWTPLPSTLFADNDRPTTTHTPTDATRNFYRLEQTDLAPFDSTGFDFDQGIDGPISLTVAMSGGPANLNTLPTTLTFNGQPIDLSTANVSRPTRQSITFDVVLFGLAPGDYTVEATYPAGPLRTGTHTIHTSILLLIVDDWGHDASPIDNTTPGAVLANMPTLSTLASEGVRFTRAYSNPTCSPMRASMLTGRLPFQNGVGDPSEAAQFSNTQDEITLPEIFTTMGAPHQMISVGKWHLGGNNTGPFTRGGWPEFYGINGGGVGAYDNWSKNNNGTTINNYPVYTTTDQVDHTSSFIESQLLTGQPFFAWVAFNAAHTPFHEPPANLAPPGGYSPIAPLESTDSHQYRMMLEALDTEMSRLLQSIDPAQTQVILIGDNGTPGQTVQAPFGDGNAKGALYNGGIHVPMLAKGPANTLPPGSTTDTIVHCTDMFATILELADIDPATVPGLPAQNIQSTSWIPVLNGTDTATRCAVAERSGTPGRAIIMGNYPDYKLIINGDPDSTLDDPTFEFFNVGAPAFDVNEQSPLDIDTLTGTALAAYNDCIAKDTTLGGGYSDPASNYDTLYLELPTTGVTPAVPLLGNGNGTPILVDAVTIDGVPADFIVGRLSSGTLLADETDDLAARYWVKVRMSGAGGGPYTSAQVTFPDNNLGQARVFSAISILVNSTP